MWVLALFLAPVFAFDDCSEYIANDCTGDPNADRISFNTGSQEKCQAHCELFDYCQFYAFHSLTTQGVDCHIYDEPFNAYKNHCDKVGGPPKEKAEQEGPCFKPAEDSCEVAQYGNCNMYGKILEGDIETPDELGCEKVCSLRDDCKFWLWSSETNSCLLYDSAEKKCNVAFGPKSGTPDECGSGGVVPTNRPDIPTVTPPPGCPIDCPPDGSLQLFADCDDCGRFYECYKGALTSMECPYCNLFDPTSGPGFCNQPPTVNCGDRPRPDPSDCNACQNPAPCLCDNGYFPDPYSCGDYYYCQDNSPDPYLCSNDTFSGLYNDKLIQCDFPERVDCEDRPVCRGPNYSQCQCQGAKVLPPASCSGTEGGVFLIEDPYNCQHFLICVDGALAEDIHCPEGQYLPEGGQDCVSGDGSQCGKRPVCGEIDTSSNCVCVN